MSTQSASIRGLVSLEGNSNTISTQLRLLPPSPKILVLPPLSTAVQLRESDVTFDARALVRHVYEAFSSRLEIARSFLHSSSGTQPRLVFMNGGSASAITTCIAVIRDKITNGNIREAEQLFNAVAKGGVAGLLHEGEIEGRHREHDVREHDFVISKAVNRGSFPEIRETRSPSTTSYIEPSVIDAANFIDRLIDSLQKPLPSLPVEGINLNMINASEYTRTTTSPEPPDVPRIKSRFWTDQQVIPKNEHLAKEGNRGRKMRKEVLDGNHDYLPYLRYTSRESSGYTAALMFQKRPGSDKDSTAPQTERPVSAPLSNEFATKIEHSDSYGEGKLSRHKKAKSASFLHSRHAKASSLDIGPHKLKLGPFSPFTFSPLLRSETSSISDSEISDVSVYSSKLGSLPDTAPAKAQETIQGSSSPFRIEPSETPRAFVDRRTYTGYSNIPEIVCTAKPDAAVVKELAPTEPIFALVEDVIIYFKDGGNNEVLESVIQSYKNGNYPILDHNLPKVPTTPNSPASLFSSDDSSISSASHTSADTDGDWPHGAPEVSVEKSSTPPLEEPSDVSSEDSSDISIYSSLDSPSVYPSDDGSIAASNGHSNSSPLWPKNGYAEHTIPGILKPRLQIPVTNPAAPAPELVTDAVPKFHDLSGINTTNTVALQDSFRDVLKIHYPPETTHYKQHIFALENDRFWKPVFRMDAKLGGYNRTVDQIVAIGYEDGIKKALYKEIVEKLDKLGTSTTGIRASKLDIRFLVIYAMQTFTSQPLSLQAGENPFSQPSLLATLLIPHLETFLSSSCSTRLLILHYPVSHLSTVLALRDLLGPELLKVVGIIDSTAISPLKHSTERPDSIASIDEWVSITTSQYNSLSQDSRIARASQDSLSRKWPQPSFSKADSLLISPATEEEISAFVASLWKSLKFPSSSIYIPDNVLSPRSTLNPIISPSTISSHNAPPTPPPDRQISVARAQKRMSPTGAPKRVSFAESTTSTEISTENARGRERQSEKDWEKLDSERRERLSEKAWESFITGNDSDENLLELERIFMPHLHFMPRAARRIGDPRKALKWLGLD